MEDRFWEKVDKSGPVPETQPELGPCWLWIGTISNTLYGVMNIGGRSGVDKSAHVVAWFVRHGRWPTMFVLHRCDNRRCVNPSHLFEGTHADNMADMVAKGRGAKAPRVTGEAHGMSRMTVDKVVALRSDRRSGVTFGELARRYGISVPNAKHIASGRTWRHVPMPEAK